MPFASSGLPNLKNLENKVDDLHKLINKRRWWEHTWVQAIALIKNVPKTLQVLTLKGSNTRISALWSYPINLR